MGGTLDELSTKVPFVADPYQNDIKDIVIDLFDTLILIFNIPNCEHSYVNMVKQMIAKEHFEHFISHKNNIKDIS